MILLIIIAIAVVAVLWAAVFVWLTNQKQKPTERDYYD